MRSRSIFFVDDDVDDQYLLRSALECVYPDFALQCASNGKDALDVLKKMGSNLPNLIFADLNMPRMNGVELVRLLKNDLLLRDIPVIAYSTSDYEGDKIQMLVAGATNYLVKPTSFNTLCQELKSLLSELIIEKID